MNPNIDYDNCPTCCANRREDRRIVDESDGGDTYCSDPWHTRPTPARDGERPMVTGGGLIKFVRDGERDEKGGERPRCACGCVDKLHDAGRPGTRRCNQPGCGCEDFTSRDGGAAKGNNEGGDRE